MSLLTAAEQRIPKYQFNGKTPEEKLLRAFTLAKQYIMPIAPQGAIVDFDMATLTEDSFSQQMRQNESAFVRSIETGEDVPKEAGLSAQSPASRAYWLSQYSIATAGIGAYASGAALRQVQNGNLSHDQYINGIAQKIQIFSQIVHSGQTGNLRSLINAESLSEQAAQTDPRVMSLVRTGQVNPQSGLLLVENSASEIARPVGGAQPAGDIVLSLVAAGVIVVVLVGSIYCAYSYWTETKKEQIRSNARAMSEICAASADEKTLEACRMYTSNIATKGTAFGSSVDPVTAIGKNLSTYLAFGAIGLAGLWMLPKIIERFEEKSERKAMRAQLREASRRSA